MADNKHRGTTLDNFLKGEGILAESQAKAISEVVAWQRVDVMNERKPNKKLV